MSATEAKTLFLSDDETTVSVDRAPKLASPPPRHPTPTRIGPELVRTRRIPRQSVESFEALDDAALLEWVLSGSDSAWIAFFRRFRALVISCAAKTAKKAATPLGPDELKDILSEVALNMVSNDHRRLRLYQPDRGSSVATWIGVIAVSTTRDYLRRLRRHPHDLVPEQELDQLAAPEGTPEQAMLDRERLARVTALLSRLSERDRRFVELYFGEALDAGEVAQKMRISLNTVYSKKAKIKERLARFYQQPDE